MYNNGLHAPLCCTIVPFEQNQEVSGAQTLREQKWDVSAGGRRSEQGLCKRPVQSQSCLCKSRRCVWKSRGCLCKNRRCLCKSKGVCAKASFRVQITCEATAVRPCGCCRTTFGQENDINIFPITDLTIYSPSLCQSNNTICYSDMCNKNASFKVFAFLGNPPLRGCGELN